ncbi:unnamed protein product [Dovyalis caffra]|uniref:Uncharacterized protein n=1 Tax=Dovyalis caffra TaxID=77055 RepID=A0AAV1R7H4_9ROSI|nr:unnamed protein product [Dovyalis caffra]
MKHSYCYPCRWIPFRSPPCLLLSLKSDLKASTIFVDYVIRSENESGLEVKEKGVVRVKAEADLFCKSLLLLQRRGMTKAEPGRRMQSLERHTPM